MPLNNLDNSGYTSAEQEQRRAEPEKKQALP
jgi:hypothetical protein